MYSKDQGLGYRVLDVGKKNKTILAKNEIQHNFHNNLETTLMNTKLTPFLSEFSKGLLVHSDFIYTFEHES